MRLYAGMTSQFVEDSTRNQIAEKLKHSFFLNFRYEPSPSEIKSWQNSLRAFSQVLSSSQLLDHGIILEYQIPLTSLRLDAMVSGLDAGKRPNAVIVELKQWDQTKTSAGDNEVLTYVGGREREVLHPSVQAGRYRTFLEDVHTVFHEEADPVQLSACSYLHNYPFDKADPIFAEKFTQALADVPLFSMDDVQEMRGFLQAKLAGGQGAGVLNRIEGSQYRPSRKLMQHVASVVKDKSEYVLLDEQLIVYDKVVTLATDKFHHKRKVAIIVKGGPGTGKSVIALNVMADLLRRDYNAQYATGSKAFNQTLRKIIGARGSQQFKSTHEYGKAERDTVDVIITDEAHRIREYTMIPYKPKNTITQTEEILNAARISVFFIDDVQVVRPGEIGSAKYLRDMAQKLGHEVFDYELDVQFRCAGSEGFINWIDNTLGIRRTVNVMWSGDENFDFKVFKTPQDLDDAIREKVVEGRSARMTAGFCWEWTDPMPDGSLPNDIAIGEYQRPWNAKPDAGKLAPGIPKAPLWANDPGGVDQVGCIYTAQGFEFDYVGVIVGRDIVFDFQTSEWVGNKDQSHDGAVKRRTKDEEFIALVKNTYRVLMTRGMKGCYVCFLDKETEAFFRSRIEKTVAPVLA